MKRYDDHGFALSGEGYENYCGGPLIYMSMTQMPKNLQLSVKLKLWRINPFIDNMSFK